MPVLEEQLFLRERMKKQNPAKIQGQKLTEGMDKEWAKEEEWELAEEEAQVEALEMAVEEAEVAVEEDGKNQ